MISKMMKILVRPMLVWCLGLLWCLSASGGQAMLVGNKHVNKYHFATCSVVKEIPPDNVITFKSPEQAVNAGYVPCSKCNPPRKSRYFVASHHSSVYHLPTCTIAQRMTADDTIYLYSPESAEQSGYKPCQICITMKSPAAEIKKEKKLDPYHK